MCVHIPTKLMKEFSEALQKALGISDSISVSFISSILRFPYFGMISNPSSPYSRTYSRQDFLSETKA